MTHLRKIMLEELQRRNYAQTTIDCYVRTVEHLSRYFHRSLGASEAAGRRMAGAAVVDGFGKAADLPGVHRGRIGVS